QESYICEADSGSVSRPSPFCATANPASPPAAPAIASAGTIHRIRISFLPETERIDEAGAQRCPARRRRRARGRTLERDVVVQVVAFLRTAGLVGAAGGEAGRIVVISAARGSAAVAASAQHGQFATELLQHDLGGVFLDAVLLVLAGLQRALDVHGRALLEVVLGDLDDVLVEDHHPVPLGLLLALAGGLVAPLLRSGQRQVGDAFAGVEGADLRVLAQIADQNDLVDA